MELLKQNKAPKTTPPHLLENGSTQGFLGVNAMMYNNSYHCEDSFMSLRGACDEAISITQKTCHCEECNDEAIQTNHEQSTSRPLEQNSCPPKQNPCHSEFISESISFETEKSNLKEFTNKTNKSCRPELVWLLFPKSFDFVKNVWFSTGPNPRGISSFNVKQFLNKFYTLSVGKMLNILNQLKISHFMLQHDMFICHCEECNDEAIQTNHEQSTSRPLEQNSCPPKQNPCHSEFISESISFETEKSNLKEFTNKTNKSCRPELVSGPNPRGISSFNKITNKFYTLSVGKMLNILNQLKISHFMLQHDMFICHCEEKMTLQTNEFSPCHCEECNDEAISITQKTCHCEELCDEAI